MLIIDELSPRRPGRRFLSKQRMTRQRKWAKSLPKVIRQLKIVEELLKDSIPRHDIEGTPYERLPGYAQLLPKLENKLLKVKPVFGGPYSPRRRR